MKLHPVATCFLFRALLCSAASFPTAQPEETGVCSEGLLRFVEAVEQEVDALHSVVLVRHGKLITEGWWSPYEDDRPHMLYSLSKSFTSTAIGIAVDEGRLGLDDKVISFFPDKRPPHPGENLKSMRIRDLLCMGTGHHHDTLAPMKDGTDADWIRVFLAQPVEHQPGTHFCYNTGATYMLSAIVQKVTGQKLQDFLTPRLFEPLGIAPPSWEISPQGINTGGYGLKVTTRDIAKLGQLYLQNGLWNGKRILSETWVQAASAKQISNGQNPHSDWNQGYGFQFWRCRHNAYRGDGAFGQYCVVMPDQDAVLAITGGLDNMQQVLDLAWTHLLPAMQSEALPPAPETQATLLKKLQKLQLHPVRGTPSSSLAATIHGKTYHFESNDKGLKTLSLNRDAQGRFLLLENVHGEQRIDCGFGSWKRSTVTFEKSLQQPVGGTNGKQSIAASSAWIAPDQHVVLVYFDETPFRLQMTLRFDDNRLIMDLEYNVAFGPRKWQLTGRTAT